MKKLLLFLTMVLSLGHLAAQDIHFSQYFNSPLNTNPALTGIFNGDTRFGLHFRQQWEAVPVDYLTFSGFADKKFLPKSHDKGFWSAGILFNYDRSGDSRLNLIQGALSGSYTFKVNPRNLVTLGAQAGLANLRADFGRSLQWGNQFNGLMFDANRDGGEPLTSDESLTNFNLGGGLNYRWQKTERTNVDIGVGAYNVVEPDETFYGIESTLPLRLSANVRAAFQMSSLIDLHLHGLAQFQEEYREYVPAVKLRFHLNQKKGRNFLLDVGGIGRLNDDELDAWTPYLGLGFNQWYLGLNYDVNASDFDIATDRQGGPEVFIRYIITKVKPLSSFKNCPIF